MFLDMPGTKSPNTVFDLMFCFHVNRHDGHFDHRVPVHFLVDLGHILVEKKYILGKKYKFLPNIYFFFTNMCPESTQKRAGTL